MGNTVAKEPAAACEYPDSPPPPPIQAAWDYWRTPDPPAAGSTGFGQLRPAGG